MRKIFVFIILIVLIQLVYAFSVSTTSYEVKSSHQGSAGNDGSTTSYTFRFTETYQQGSNPNVVTTSYTGNSGWFERPVGDEPPIIFNVSSVNTVFLSSGPLTTPVSSSLDPAAVAAFYDGVDTIILLQVSDANGFTNLDDNTAQVELTKAGEVTVQNLSCIRITGQSSGIFANYTCGVDMFWYSGAGSDWRIRASIDDINANNMINDTTFFTVALLTSFTVDPDGLTFPTISPGIGNQESNNDPLIINNTGNSDILAGNIDMATVNLTGGIDDQIRIESGSFTIGTDGTGIDECLVAVGTTTAMVNDNGLPPVPVTITGAFVNAGDFTLNDGTAQEELFVCLAISDPGLTAQDYSTSNSGAPWVLGAV